VPAGASVAAVSVACAVVAFAALRWQCPWLIWLAVAVAWSWMRVDVRSTDQIARELVGEDLAVSGWVDDFPVGSPRQRRFSLRVQEAPAGLDLPDRIRLTWYDPPLEISAGAKLDLVVRLRQPHGLVNPGGLDYERWLFERGIGATGYVRSGAAAIGGTNGGLERYWLELRARLAKRLRHAVASTDAQALLVALTIGERTGFNDAYWTTLRRTGTSHLVAISGLHIGIVSALLFALTRWLWLRGPAAIAVFDLEAASVICLIGAAGYAALAGFALPTQRALIMLAIVLTAVVLRRVISGEAGMSAALLCVLIWDPFAPLSASFWLSFAAVAILWQLARQRALRVEVPGRRAAAVRVAVRTQWGMTLGLLPLAAMFFGEISLVSPLINLIAIPIFGLMLVPLTLTAAAALVVAAPVGTALLACAAQAADWINWMLTLSATIGWSSLRVPELSLVACLLLVAGSICALPVHPLPGRHLGWLAIVAALAMPQRALRPGAMRATVLDVGHGLAVLVETRKHVMLYDTGARSPLGLDAGRDIVLPAMRHMGISHLDRVVVSHADNDHAGGLDTVLAEFPDAELIAGPDVERSGAGRCHRGDRWTWDEVQFRVLHPPPAYAAKGNDSSCVLEIRAAGRALLLTGDIERRGEADLQAAVPDLTADVVVAPHHGSATSSSPSITSRIGAGYAIFSAGYANRWGFPKAVVVDRWRAAGAQAIVTSESGAVQVSFDPGSVLRVTTERGRWRRPWAYSAPH